jgi:hypothetical protein
MAAINSKVHTGNPCRLGATQKLYGIGDIFDLSMSSDRHTIEVIVVNVFIA